NDFCDWYVERAKPVLRDGGDAAGQAAGVLAACLDASLRLMQPVIPFATERLWWALSDVRPERGVPGLNLPASNRCISASWPTSDGSLVSDDAEAAIATVQEVVQAIRTVRNENKVEPRRKVPVTIKGASDVLQRNAELIRLWATCESVSFDDAEPDAAAKTTAAGAEIFVAGVVDAAAEEGRLAKEKADLAKKIKTLQGRLSNKGYTDKAPAHLVQQTRDELAAAEAELAKLG
ncbi:MAG: class I tRNA ligase family protein, partial [Planctomycetota bacterium]